MRTFISLLSVLVFIGLTGCQGNGERTGVGGEQQQAIDSPEGTGSVGEGQDTGMMQEEGEQRAPAATGGEVNQEQCQGLQEGGILDEEQELFQQCQEAGYL